VAYIPDQFIIRGIECVMDGSSEFNHAQAGAQVSRVTGNDFEDKLPDILAQEGQLIHREFPEIIR
jgi:hypothetical protein